jgi:hypothetical protein
MDDDGPTPSPAGVGRVAFGAATILTALLGLTGDRRWLAASGAFGTLWWFWDLVWENVASPFGDWIGGLLTGSVSSMPEELTADDTIRMLEGTLENEEAERHVRIQAALRLAELYRYARRDPRAASAVLRSIRERYPDAPELDRAEAGEAGQ